MVRNPLYFGNILIAAGLSFLPELVWFVPIVILYLFVLYHFVILYEEQKLSERWGEHYRTYLNEVLGWVPRLKNISKIRDGGFRGRNAFRSEVPSLYISFFAILVFYLKEFISHLD